jgi:predicted transcriptional regulator YdeE
MIKSEFPRLVTIPEMRIAGIGTRASNSDTEPIGLLWMRFFSDGISQQVEHAVADSPIYGVYSDYESDVNGAYTLTAGVCIPLLEIPATSLGHVDIQSGLYLEFAGKGAMPDIVINTWKQVWDYFSAKPEFQRAYTTDFEQYGGMDEVSVFISIR